MTRRLRRFHLWLALLLALGAGIRLAVLLSAHDWIVFRVPVLDAGFYHDTARGLLAGEWPRAEPYFMGPLYTYVLGGLYALFGGDPLVGRAANLVLGVLTLWLTGVTTRRVAGDVAALAAVFVGVLYGPSIFYEQVLLLATLLTLLAVVVYERTLALTERGGWRAAVPLGLALGAAVALRGSAALYILPVAWAARRRLLGRDGVLALVCAGAVIAPFTVHNLTSGSSTLLTTNLGWNLFIGNHGGARGMFAYPNGWRAEGDPTGREFASELAGRALDADETNAFWLRQTRAAVARDPLGTAARAARKLYLFLQPSEIPQNESYRFYLMHVPPARVAMLGWWVLLPLAVLGVTVSRRAQAAGPRAVSSALLFALVPLVACAIFFVTGRYRLPSVPFLTMLAGVGTAWLLGAAGREPRRAVLATLAVVVTSLALLAVPAPFDVARALARDYEHVGLRYQREGAVRVAEEQYRLALEIEPDDGDALNNLGTVLVSQDRLAEAIAVYEHAARVEPGNPVPLRNLASVRGSLGDDAGAEAALRAAIHVAPDDAVSWTNLGAALALQERFEEAIEAFERADRLDPENRRIQGMLRSAREFLDASRTNP